MAYFCEKCNKYHADKYYKHLKYKKQIDKDLEDFCNEIDELAESEPQAFCNSHEIAGLSIRIKELEHKVNLIIIILKKWKLFIDNKHPYKQLYQEEFKALN